MKGGACTTDGCRCAGYAPGPITGRCSECHHDDAAHEYVAPRGAPPAWLLSPLTWLTIGLIALGIAFGVSLVSNRHSAEHAAHAAADAAAAKAIAEGERNARLAEKRAGIEATYQACVRSIPTLVNVNDFVNAMKGLSSDLLRNSRANHRATPPTNPQYQTQIQNIRRLEKRVKAASKVEFPVPTVKRCKDRRVADLKALAATDKPDAPLQPKRSS